MKLFSRSAQLAMELTGNNENQVKAGPDRDKEKKRTRWASSNGCFAQLCKIPTDVFYCACAILASELSKLQEPIICRKSDQVIPL